MKWQEIIKSEQKKEYYQKLKYEINKQYENSIIFPPKEKIFAAFSLTPIEKLKVVILGQDPYCGINQAHGLAFSTPANIPNPPSMQNILKEIKQEYKNESICSNGDLTPWAKQGILLLNTILTVKANETKSHCNLGWEIFTNNIISYISNNCKDIIFLLWGLLAIEKQNLIDKTKHHILTAPHPSPLSAYRGFFGCNHFIKTNQILKKLNKTQIIW
jgi:uracil-DNA glycosylase